MKPDVYLLELALTTFLCFVAMVDMTSNRTIDILMPGVTTHEEDEYWCTFIPAPEDETYIKPGSYEDKWHCHTGCKSGSALLFAWAFHAEPTHLPPDVGFTIGGSTSRYLTLQVHYRVIVKEHHIDMSCQFHSNTPIYPFAFRVHAHRLGKVYDGVCFD
ncbi:hypothetical protein LSH36_375g01014 [Paralvinella palmiformis]|uniref:Copper type II ascorbate-dependent monooxygenase N-terminal domain-containing protein n=1 Tax=Paralvinella palmiformis TaxID=53620 RepID=A0AAD9JEV8_9ANNE|nr:hypothetical protein LSH36_375g01014 [Paralvinella palmiformis]